LVSLATSETRAVADTGRRGEGAALGARTKIHAPCLVLRKLGREANRFRLLLGFGVWGVGFRVQILGFRV
jgi:hypothetical protein